MDWFKGVKFIDHKVALSKPHSYVEVVVDVAAVLESWRLSVFSFEWLDQDGQIKGLGELKAEDQERWRDVEVALTEGTAFEKPVLGIGMMDNVEIGSGKATFLSLAARGAVSLPVHIPKSNEGEFQAFLFSV